MYYTTLLEVKRYLKLQNIDTDDALFLRWIRYSSKLIELYKGRRYDIRRETINFDTPMTNSKQSPYENIAYTGGFGDSISNTLRIYEDLISVEELVNGDGSIILPSEYVLLDRHLYPKFAIKLKEFSDISFELDDDGNSEEVISVDGYWGHVDLASCWVLSGNTVINTPLGATDIVLTVQGVSGAAGDLLSPRFEVGMMLKVEEEFLFIVEITENDAADDELTVTRGYNGTTAVEHIATTPIYVFRPNDNIAQMTLRLVAWRYRQKDADTFDKTYNMGEQSISIPTSLPADVQAMLGSRKVRML